MNKEGGKKAIVIGVFSVIVLIVLAFLYFSLVGFDYSSRYKAYEERGTLVNPVSEYSTEEAIVAFNQDFVYYLLYEIGAYNLRSAFIVGGKPIIQIYTESDSYYAEVERGNIIVSKGTAEKPDITIRTTRLESVLMLQDAKYITESFSSGKSTIDLNADKSLLFAKGYLKLYTNLTGKSITGNIVAIYTN